jgi:hypothetical protein
LFFFCIEGQTGSDDGTCGGAILAYLPLLQLVLFDPVALDEVIQDLL